MKTTILLINILSLSAILQADMIMEDFSDFSTNRIGNLDSTAELIETNGNKAILATLGCNKPWPNVTIKGQWNVAAYTHVKADITNLENKTIKIGCRVDNPGATGKKNNSGSKITVEPGHSSTVSVELNRPSPHNFQTILKGMSAFPDGTKDGATLNPSNVIAVQFFGFRPSSEQKFVIDNIRAVGDFDYETFNQPIADPFMPFIDEFGQYIHKDWPGKTHGIKDLKRQAIKEKTLISEYSNDELNKYGGWLKGPELKATGHFRTENYKGKWWFVDPEGRLFWSFGSCCVRSGGATAISNRNGWFKNLPPETNNEFSIFYGKKKATRGDYKGQYLTTYDFGSANLYRKFGKKWKEQSVKLSLERLPFWGLNTLGCWSDPNLFNFHKIPYTHWIFYRVQNIRVWGMTHKMFPDLFDPNLESELEKRAKNMAAKYKDDPYCIGFYIDNEIPWGTMDLVGKIALKAPADQPAKIAMIDMLKKKYNQICNLNKAWGTEFADWSELNGTVEPPSAADDDMKEYCKLMAEHYFSTCAKIMKKVVPDKLYLGCRFAQYNPIVVEVADKYCDVLSFNLYVRTVKNWETPVKVNKPVIIGEFHFGAKDRGPFASSLVGVKDQNERAAALKNYITGALQNPLIIGATWFQYRDEPTTGRILDEESHQIGFVDICDTPYTETIQASKEVSSKMYETRLKETD